MLDRRFNPAPLALALALLTALTMSACGQSPSSAPTSPMTATPDLETSGLFRTPNEKAVILFLKAVADARQVTQIEVSKTGEVRSFTATAKVVNPGSMFWPQLVEQRWEGQMKSEGPTRNPDRSYILIQGRYLDALPGQKTGPGPLVKKVIEL
jgi:hypothetical protein